MAEGMARLTVAQQQWIAAHLSKSTIRRRLAAAYPAHPHLVSLFLDPAALRPPETQRNARHTPPAHPSETGTGC